MRRSTSIGRCLPLSVALLFFAAAGGGKPRPYAGTERDRSPVGPPPPHVATSGVGAGPAPARSGAVATASPTSPPPSPSPRASGVGAGPAPARSGPAAEPHLADIRQLTSGGENAEAYWSPDGKRLIFQRTAPEGGCDQMYVLDVAAGGAARPVSSGRGRNTCGFFLPDGRYLYSTTELFAPDCPPPPDRSRGYTWSVYGTYEIVLREGEGPPRRLTDNQAYDAEATVCPRDGSIVFTSDRDGDLELYRMNGDGSGVVRLTSAPGYDGGAVFSPDCSRIVWRASRPQGAALDDYRQLLANDLVRPSKLELWVAKADGTDAHQVTYLGAASFAPAFFPDADRIIFSSNFVREPSASADVVERSPEGRPRNNFGDPAGREFELWAIDSAGTRLQRLTASPGFDGFPMFSPDGRQLAFATNRFPDGPHVTNIAVARWVDAPVPSEESPADRFLADVSWLADDAREGRGVGTAGLAAAAEWIEARFRELGLVAGGTKGYRHPLRMPLTVRAESGTRLRLDGRELALGSDFVVAAFSSTGAARGDVVPVGYGIVAAEQGRDDYAGVDVRGKVALVRRFVPPGDAFADPELARRFGDLRYKAFTAREHGAVALLVVDLPEGEPVDEAPLPVMRVEQRGDAGIPVLVVRREVAGPLFAGAHTAETEIRLATDEIQVDNVVGVLRATAAGRRGGPIVLGAHYDHLGRGDRDSLAPESHEIHNGADDNASGVAALLEAARLLAKAGPLARDVWFVAFTGEEEGTVGSTALVRQPPPGLALGEVAAMLNFDMVGRLRDNRVSVLGSDSAAEWTGILEAPCRDVGLDCAASGDGYGPSDQTAFYAAGVPVLHFFTGAHEDYHKPGDDAGKINAAGGAHIADLAARVATALAGRESRLTYQRVAPPAPSSADVRSYGASLGTIPDYVGPPAGTSGVLLAGTRPGGPAEKAGLRRGDVLVELAGTPIRDVNDFMFVLRTVKPGQTSTAVVLRDGERLKVAVTFDQSRRR